MVKHQLVTIVITYGSNDSNNRNVFCCNNHNALFQYCPTYVASTCVINVLGDVCLKYYIAQIKNYKGGLRL